MNVSRRLAVLALPLLAAACSSPEPTLYTLQMTPGPVLHRGPRVVEVRDIGLASYLDRREIVRSSEGYKLDIRSNDWWGEPLGAMLSRIIVIGLSQRLPGSSIYAEAGAISADPNAIVSVNVQRLDIDRTGVLELLAQANVEFNRPTRSVSRTFQISKPVPSRDSAGEAAAISAAVAELTDGLAALLQR
jgi:uncharacterized lipoprotein YmbA